MEGQSEVPAPGRGGDQVEAARAWLRGHGVELDPETDPETDLDPDPDPVHPTGRWGGPVEEQQRRSGPDGSAGGAVGGDRAGRSGGRPAAAAGPSGGLGSGGRRTRRARSSPDPAVGVQSGAGGTDDPDADPQDVARRVVLRKLAARARTRAELERALEKRSVPAQASAAVLDRMGEVGLVDDVAFARDWVASRQQRRHLSRSALRRELQTKGVDREVIDGALDAVDGADEHRAALDLVTRRAASLAGVPREVAYRRLGGVLARRGFSSSVSARVLAEVLGSSEP